MLISLLNIFGLVFDIIGAWVVFKYALPLHQKNKTSETIIHRHDHQFEKEKKDIKKYDKVSKIGFSLIMTGFALQLIGNVISLLK